MAIFESSASFFAEDGVGSKVCLGWDGSTFSRAERIDNSLVGWRWKKHGVGCVLGDGEALGASLVLVVGSRVKLLAGGGTMFATRRLGGWLRCSEASGWLLFWFRTGLAG